MASPYQHWTEAQFMDLWRRCVSNNGAAAPMEQVISELSTFYKLPADEVRRRCVEWEEESVAQWHSADRSTPDSIVEFFQTQTSWIFDTMRYHADQCNGDAFPETVDVTYALRDLPPGSHLDFGAGPGTSSMFYSALGWRVTLADISTSFLEFARWRLEQRGIQASYINTAEQRLPADSYDLVTAYDVMVHIPDIQAALLDLHRAMRPNGILVFNIDSRPHGPTTEYHFFDQHYPILKLMGKAGFKHVRNIGFFYVYQRVERTPVGTYFASLYDSLRHNPTAHRFGRSVRKVRQMLRPSR